MSKKNQPPAWGGGSAATPGAAWSTPGSQSLFAKGVNGQVTVDNDFVTIGRKGFVAKMTGNATKGEKRIPIGAIAAVQFKKPGMTNGYIQFTVPGGNESRRGVFDASSDENTVMFNRGDLSEFEKIRAAVEQQIISRAAAPVPTTVVHQAPAASLADELAKLAALRDQGVLTDDEFAVQKTRLLGG
jgi:hypothetical protein